MNRIRLVLLLLLVLPGLAAAEVVVRDVRTWTGPDGTRIVLDLTAPPEHRVFTLKDPQRVVLDLADTRLDSALVDGIRDEGPLQRIRTGRRGDGVRVVLDLNQESDPKTFLVRPNETYGHRLVVDLERPRGSEAPVKTAADSRDAFVVAIDAGHGGEDPGAIGAAGTLEKTVVLSVARRLAALVDRQPGIRAVLIRDGDYYIGLRERTVKAHEANADLFLSLHADAFHQRTVRGSSVFVLSENGASSEMARMLARSENRADRIGGVSLEDKDDQLASVLLDLSRAATIEASTGLAEALLGQLAGVGDVHGGRVEKAGFAVLKSLDIPSVLVELAFISNPEEERRLRSDAYQERLAQALFEGLRDYARNHMPALRLAGGEYTVRRGDTLSGIARRHSISVSALREANGLDDDIIMAGRTLQIP
ncbi:N-acetylmuramoyl-L-alanine amidase [Sediminicurvatus halobius]|uniref:N-acetylmuramoyl-L-alanine amidase AmiC n=1 Tax=Sediminicurvatus halobius TaxID=2182432 RepID=A0A2U2N1E1_9GAMM|nr:N-acetylmuramoyl-L-alanine amidase [Spiribacter halobius]PWG62877.1 N-acetylmuramoyl-L-alanine amidase [Spiribacter halobius]UEX76971.1 N-acetylmuramoyl-L-alanine amidase [Spiribacter halobius]